MKPPRPMLSLLTAALLAGCGSAGAGTPVSSGPAPVTVGRTLYASGQRPAIPNLSGRLLGGARFSLASLSGHIVVINAWASWCYPCRLESPDLAKVAAEFAAQGVEFVGIDEQDIDSHARAFILRAGVRYRQLLDPDGSLLLSLKVVPPAAIPSTLVLDRSGRVAVRFVGQTDAASLTAALRGLL